jgi:ribosome-associated protein
VGTHPTVTVMTLPKRDQRRTIRTNHQEVPIESDEVCRALALAAVNAKGADVAVLDLRRLVDYTDLVLLVTARNRRHVQAIADEIRRVAKKELQIHALSVEGVTAGRWVLVDFGTVVVHIFDEPMRAFYNLDGLWSDAPRLPVPNGAGAEESTHPPYPG